MPNGYRGQRGPEENAERRLGCEVAGKVTCKAEQVAKALLMVILARHLTSDCKSDGQEP